MTSRERHLLKKYGLFLHQYNELLAKNDGRCWICDWKPKPGQRQLAVDHDHKTGRIRGLLCNHRCNRFLLPWMDFDWLYQAARYLENPTMLYVPEKRKKAKRGRRSSTTRPHQ